MAEKQFNTRIINKHDTAANWAKATNFIPKKSELIVYDADTANTQPRLKIGDGTTTVINLPFVTDITNTGDITGVTAGNGLTGGGSFGSVTLNVGAGSGITVAADTVSVNTGYTTSGKNYKVAVDSTSGGLYVNVPWTDTNTTYSAATTSANGLMTSTMVTKLNGIATGATKDTAVTTAETNSICV